MDKDFFNKIRILDGGMGPIERDQMERVVIENEEN